MYRWLDVHIYIYMPNHETFTISFIYIYNILETISTSRISSWAYEVPFVVFANKTSKFWALRYRHHHLFLLVRSKKRLPIFFGLQKPGCRCFCWKEMFGNQLELNLEGLGWDQPQHLRNPRKPRGGNLWRGFFLGGKGSQKWKGNFVGVKLFLFPWGWTTLANNHPTKIPPGTPNNICLFQWIHA